MLQQIKCDYPNKIKQTKKNNSQGGTKTYGYYKTKLSYYITQRKNEYEIIEQLTKDHHNKIYKYSKKIKILLRQLSRVREREWAVRNILDAAEEFMSIKLRYWNTTKKAQLGRNLVYKYALEKKIAGNVIAEVLKCGKTIPSKQRTRFTKSFQVKPENAELYHSFVSYVKRQ